MGVIEEYFRESPTIKNKIKCKISGKELFHINMFGKHMLCKTINIFIYMN